MNPNDSSRNPLDHGSEYDDARTESEIVDISDTDEAGYDDAEIYDENWDESADESETLPAHNPVKKKKSPLLTALVIGAALIVGGGIFMAKFSKNSAPTPEQTVSTEQKNLMAIQNEPTQEDQAAVAPSPAPAAETSPKGFMDDPGQLAKPDQADAPPVTDTSATDPAPALTSPAPDQSGQTEALSSQTAPVAPAPSLAESAPDISSSAAAVTTEPTPVNAVTPPQSASADAAINAELQAKLDQAMSRIDSLEKKLAEEAAKPPEPVAAAPDQSAEINSLKATIAGLESKVSDLSARQSAMPVSAPSPTDNLPESASVVSTVAEKSIPKSVKKPAAKKKPAAVSSSKWELRGVGAGEAMIGRPGQADYTTIRVGDVVPDMGQVQAIEQVNGAWSIRTPGGRIVQ